MLTVACVQVGNYAGRGEEYVRVLHDMVQRNLSVPFRFVCFTDAPLDGIECEAVPFGVTGWWAKLWMFERLRDESGLVLYLDLDTVVTGSLDEIAKYGGRFAILRDFYRPDGYGSGMMLWRGDHSSIWQYWADRGMPKPRGGDQEWIEQIMPVADRIQDLWPGKVCSFKQHAQDWPPGGTAVVCFHGEPRPHNCFTPWVEAFWRIGGLAEPRFITGLNNSPEAMLANARANLERDLPTFVPASKERPRNKQRVVMVAGGPSLQDTMRELQWQAARGDVWAFNGTHDYLVDRGIVPHTHVMLDSRPQNVGFVGRPQRRTRYLMSAMCDPAVFEAVSDYDTVMWFNDMPGMKEVVAGVEDRPVVLVGGGATVGLKAMILAYMEGYRSFHLFGFDSCYAAGAHHAYAQPINDAEAKIDIVVLGRPFRCARWMARQAQQFQAQARVLLSRGCDITAHGDGLIQHILKEWARHVGRSLAAG